MTLRDASSALWDFVRLWNIGGCRVIGTYLVFNIGQSSSRDVASLSQFRRGITRRKFRIIEKNKWIDSNLYSLPILIGGI